ncbi:prephenate dehydrogenase/arogenate dehydrogenase family protein [Halobaculum lipolyticum]|uniref:Prephenate dehydrogenase/arogenate dehydrogenase family protein n=1 Tax=Halobaculum lipolyticum TaxID=3032001 RepID=A0ABD5WJ85_9EURY|nr:prephenate dehydrogenase/arogenate dehydrogenase family protein [Halobaculum sp. DT31]
MKLLVVGAGEMGRWAARTLRPVADRVALADTNPQAAMDAAEAVVDGRVVPVDTDETFDCVVLAVPIPAVADAVAGYADNVPEGAIVDVSGEMGAPLAAMAEHARDEYASFHPLFAPPRGPGRVAFVPGDAGPVVAAVRERFAAVGNDVFETTAADHDDAMGKVQTGAHAAVLAYALAAGDVDGRFHTPVSEPLAALARTVTEGESRVYADIREAFDGADAVADAARALAVADREEFDALFAAARDAVDGDSRVGGADADDDGPDSEATDTDAAPDPNDD